MTGTFSCQQQTVRVETGIDDVKSVVCSACRKENWLLGEGIFRLCLSSFGRRFLRFDGRSLTLSRTVPGGVRCHEGS